MYHMQQPSSHVAKPDRLKARGQCWRKMPRIPCSAFEAPTDNEKAPSFVETTLPTETKFKIRNFLQGNALKAQSHIEVSAAFRFNLRKVLLVVTFFVRTWLD